MEIQQLSAENLKNLIELVLELWTDCDFDEEYEAYKSILNSESEICYLIKDRELFVGFIHLSIRKDYVEGATELPVAYIEALYVKPNYQKAGIGKILMTKGENWGKLKGCEEIASDTELNNLNAIAFHEKLGFEEANRIVCFIKKI